MRRRWHGDPWGPALVPGLERLNSTVGPKPGASANWATPARRPSLATGLAGPVRVLAPPGHAPRATPSTGSPWTRPPTSPPRGPATLEPGPVPGRCRPTRRPPPRGRRRAGHLFHDFASGEIPLRPPRPHRHLQPALRHDAPGPTVRLRLRRRRRLGPHRTDDLLGHHARRARRRRGPLGPDPPARRRSHLRVEAHPSPDKPIGLLLMEQDASPASATYPLRAVQHRRHRPRRAGGPSTAASSTPLWREAAHQFAPGVRRNRIVTMRADELQVPVARLPAARGATPAAGACGRCHRARIPDRRAHHLVLPGSASRADRPCEDRAVTASSPPAPPGRRAADPGARGRPRRPRRQHRSHGAPLAGTTLRPHVKAFQGDEPGGPPRRSRAHRVLHRHAAGGRPGRGRPRQRRCSSPTSRSTRAPPSRRRRFPGRRWPAHRASTRRRPSRPPQPPASPTCWSTSRSACRRCGCHPTMPVRSPTPPAAGLTVRGVMGWRAT